MSTAALELIIRLKDQASKELAGLAERVRDVGNAAKEAEGKTGGLGAGVSGLGGLAKAAAVGLAAVGVAAVGVGTAMVKGNAEFERYQTQFGVLLGSATAAKQRLEELAAFGASTPFELPEVVQADKVLQSFRIHSQEMLTTVGDVAAGTGAKFGEMANLIGKFSAGATGEAISRFQELGITTRKELAELGLKFSKAGELLSPLPEAMTVITKVMRDRFGGMMAAQSQTFEGMLSNLQDWVGQATRTLGAPLFDVLKVQLGELLAYLNQPATQAALKSMAQGLADGIKVAVPMIVSGLKTVASVVGTMISVIGPIARFVADNFIPAIAGAGAALAAFAAVTLAAAIPSEVALLAIIMQTIPAMIAQAVAAAAAVAPFALIAVAVYGMAKAWESYNEKHTAALNQLLESRKWWTDAEQALKDYSSQAGYVKDATKTQADALKQLTDAQKADLDSLARRMELGQVSGAQYQTEMAAINARIPAINAATAALTHETEALSENSLRATDAIENARLTQGAHQAMGAQMEMTAEQAKTLADALAKIGTAGTAALASLIPTTAAFLSSLSTAASAHAANVAAIIKDSNTQFGQIAAARAKIFADAGKTFGKIESDLSGKLSDIAKATGAKLAEIETSTGTKLADIAKQATAKIADINKQLGGKLADINAASSEKIADINKQLGAKLADIAKQAGAKIADINKATGQKIADINKQAAEKLAAIDKKAIDERAAAYTALQKAIATSMADMVAAQEANDLDLAGATGDRLAELRRRETTEAASRERLAAAAIEAQQRAAKGEAAIAGQIYGIRQDGIGKQASLDEAYAKRREELANDPAALAELKRQYDEATAALQAAEQQRVSIVEAEQREKEAQRAQEKADVRAAQTEQIAAARAAAAEQIAATKQAAGEQIAAAKQAATEQRQATLEAAAKQRADAQQQAAEARQAAQQQAAEQTQAALKQVAEQRAAALVQAGEQRAAAQQQASEARAAAGAQLAEQIAANNAQLAAAGQARAEKLAADQAAYALEQQQAAEAYAKQAADQREHLGVILIDRVNALAAAGLVTKEQAAAMTASLKTEYGVAETNAALTFGKMSATLDAWAANGGKNSDFYTGKLHGIETQSVATQVKLDAMAKEYQIKILEDFNAKRLNAEQYAAALARIPAQVRTQLELEMVAKLSPMFAPGPRRNGGAVGDDSVLPRRARGGPVSAGQAYIVGEQRPELFVPKQSGTIIPDLNRFTTMPVGSRTMLPETPGRQRGDFGNVSISAPITINMPPGGPPGGAPDMAQLRREVQGIVDEVFAEAVDRLIGRDL